MPQKAAKSGNEFAAIGRNGFGKFAANCHRKTPAVAARCRNLPPAYSV
jgi:hypothetical protein